MTEETPQGWQFAKLGEIASKIGSGATPRGGSESYQAAGIPLIRSQNVRFEGFTGEGLAFLNRKQAEALREVTVQSGDVLLNITGASIGRVTQAPSEMDGARVNQHVCIIRPRDGINAKFLARFLASPDVQEMIWTEQYGVTRQALTKSQILDFNIPIPPAEEQLRIATKLEDLLRQVESCQQRLGKISAFIKRFRQSVLAAACSGRLTDDWRLAHPNLQSAEVAIDRLRKASNAIHVRRGVPEDVQASEVVLSWDLPSTWKSYSAAELLRIGAFMDLKDGNHGSNHPKVSEFSKSGLPFITAAQVNNFAIDYDGAYKLAGVPLERINVGFAKPGDVIYTHKGSVGRVAVADRECILTPQTTYYRLSPEIFESRFVMYCLASDSMSKQVDTVKEQTTRDFVPISEQYLLFHRIPPFAEQTEIVRRVDEWFKLANKIENHYKVAKHSMDRLPQSFLAKAFHGELVLTEAELAVREGRSYESAEQLLERIRAAKPGVNSKGKTVPTVQKRRAG